MQPSSGFTLSLLRIVTVETIGDILYWPVWWYSKGLLKVGLFCIGEIIEQYQQLALGVWIKNVFVPMFGQYDWEGRVISFFARVVQIIGRTIVLAVWACIMFVIFCLWLVVPLGALYQIWSALSTSAFVL